MTIVLRHPPRAIIRCALWLLRRVLYGPTFYDRLRSSGLRECRHRCMRWGGGTLVYADRGPVPRWLEFLP